MTTVWFATVVANLSDFEPLLRSGTRMGAVLVLENTLVRVAEARIGAADASSPPRAANKMAGAISRLARRILTPAVEKPALPAAKRGMRGKWVMGATLVYPHFFIVAFFLDLPVLDNELNGGIALNDGRRASEHRHCTGLRPECAKSEGTQHDAHSCRSEVFPDQISVPFMGKRIAAKFKPSGITTILESDDSRVKPIDRRTTRRSVG